MASITDNKELLKSKMKYNLSEFFENYHESFDLPPLKFNRPEDMGWKMLANAIISNTSGKYN